MNAKRGITMLKTGILLMKVSAAVAIMTAVAMTAEAQSTDLGGVGAFVSDVARAARGGSAMDLNKHISGVLFIAYPEFHSADGQTEYGLIGIGANIGTGAVGDTVHATPALFPAINAPGIVSRIFGGPWSHDHLTFPVFGTPVWLGVEIDPFPIPGVGGKWIIGNQVKGLVSIGFGKAK